MSGPIAVAALSSVQHESREFLRNRYFLLGVAVQKGAPLLLLPLVVSVIGASVYAHYVLLYTVVQVFAVVSSLSLAQALIPFWNGQSDHRGLTGSLLASVLILQLLMSVPLLPLAWLALGSKALPNGAGVLLALVWVYAAVYNLNQASLNLVRVRLRQGTFFAATLASAFMLLLAVAALKWLRGDRLVAFTLVNIGVLALQTYLYVSSSGIQPRLFAPAELVRACRQWLAFTAPLTAYTLVVLTGLVVDKWVVKAFFDTHALAAYVLDFQFAFALTLLSYVIGMYNTQRVCQLVHLNDLSALRRNWVGNHLLSLVGSLLFSGCVYLYATRTGVVLSGGYWLLAAAFTLNNCYGVNSNLLAAYRKGNTLALLGLVCTGGFMVALLLAGSRGSLEWVYGAYVLYYGLMLASSTCSLLPALRSQLTAAVETASPH